MKYIYILYDVIYNTGTTTSMAWCRHPNMHARVLTIMHTVYWAIVLLNYTEGMLSQSIYYVVLTHPLGAG